MQNRLLDVFFRVYPFVNDVDTHQLSPDVEAYKRSVFIQVISFMGFTNDYLPDEKSHAKMFLRNLFGWPVDSASGLRKSIAVLFAPFYLLFNIIKVVGTLPVNILKLVTEFTPLLFAELVKSHKAAHIFFKILYFIGSAITSPVSNIQRVWEFRQQHGKPIVLIMAGLSFAITVTTYALLFPVVLKLVIVKLPIVAPRALGYLAHQLSPFLKPVFNELGKHVMHVLEAILQRTVGISTLVRGYVKNKVGDLIAYCKKPKEAPASASAQVPVKSKASTLPTGASFASSSKKIGAIFGFKKAAPIDVVPARQALSAITQQPPVRASTQRASSSAPQLR